MKLKYFFLFLVVSISFYSFAVQKQSIYHVVIQQKDIQFKGSREFWKLISFPSQDGLFLQRLPLFHFLQMQKRKRNGIGANNSNTTTTGNSRKEYVTTSTSKIDEEIIYLKKRLIEIEKRKSELAEQYNAIVRLRDQEIYSGEFKIYEA